MTAVRLRRFWRDRSGATALEFAILAGPLLLFLIGTVEAGRALWTRQALYETAIAGARCIGIRQTECAVNGVYSASKAQAFVIGVASGWGLPLLASGVTLNASTTCAGVAGFAQVSLAYDFQTVVPLMMAADADGIALAANACFPNQP